MTFDHDASLRLVGEALGMVHLLEDIEQITVRNVSIVDQSLTVEVMATSDDPILLRVQAASVMGGLSGLDIPELFPVLTFGTFAVRLVDGRGDDVFWVMSSPEDAEFAKTGAVRWLANSITQENTANYRRSQADRLIGRLETGLRDLLQWHWETTHGAQYASKVFTPTLHKDLRKMARREGEDELDDRTLLDFTLLSQLATLVCEEPLLVAHGCVSDVPSLKTSLAKVNKIRRKVAHHRHITNRDLDVVKDVVTETLRPVGEHHPDLIADFLADRWDEAVQPLMSELTRGMRTEEPPPAGTMPEPDRQKVALAMLEQQLEAARTANAGLASLVVPATRQSVHELAMGALRDSEDALNGMVVVAGTAKPNLDAVRLAADRHAETMARLRTIGDEMQRIRVMEHSVQ